MKAPPKAKLEHAARCYKRARRLYPAIQASLTPALLSPYWRRQADVPGEHKTLGHCGHASEALWHMIGGRRSTFRPYVIWDLPDDESHLFLRCVVTERNVDPTSAQFLGKHIPYARAKRYSFGADTPSRKAQIVLARTRRILAAKQNHQPKPRRSSRVGR